MNNCVFIGTFVENPVLQKDSEGVAVTAFVLEVDDFRKDKGGSKRKFSDSLDFQAWHTGAEVIVNSSNLVDYLRKLNLILQSNINFRFLIIKS